MAQQPRSRRAFLRTAAAAAAVPVAAELAACSAAHPAAARPRARLIRHRPIPESSLPGDPRWDISQLGAPDAIMGYAGRASVLAGEPVPLFVSTTSRSFRV